MSGVADLIKKADLALSDLAAGGLLTVEQSDRFFRKLIKSPTILRQVRTVVMSKPEMEINKIGFGTRIMRPAASATPLIQADRAKPDLGKVTLSTKEVIAEVRIPYDVLEDNIEGGNIAVDPQSGAGGLHGTLVDLIAERAALDFEELLLLGDTGSADSYLALVNGFLKLSTSHVVNVGGAFDKDAVKAGLKTLPVQYLRNRAALKHFVSVNNETEYRDTYASRATALGDTQLQGTAPLYGFGTLIEGAPMMPETHGLFTNPQNLIAGFHRRVTMEFDKDITARVFIIVLTTRIGCEIEEEDAVVKYTGITG